MIQAAEKESWYKDVGVFWQNKKWVDSVVMRDLARKFFAYNIEVHGEGVWFIMFLDNPIAQLYPEVKQFLGESRSSCANSPKT